MEPNHEELRYKPSWVDRFNSWAETVPVNVWIFYTILGIVLILFQVFFLWVDRGLYANELLPVIIFNGFAVPFLLAMVYLLDNQAMEALNAMKPMLEMSETEYDDYKYRLSNMPFLVPLIAGLAMVVFVLLMERFFTTPVRYTALEQLPVFTVVFFIVDKGSAFLVGVFLYHNIRQLRLVNAINSHHTRINLFNMRHLHAFSRLTASTAVGFLFFLYLWMLINPELFADPAIFGLIVVMTILAVFIFGWPLWGVHRLLVMEKERALDEIDHNFEAVFSRFNQKIHDNDYVATERLSRTIASLDIQQKRINDIPTWPWRSETARLLLTSIALPIVLMIIQYIVLQALDR